MKLNSYGGLRRLVLAAMIVVPLVPFIFVLAIGYYYFTGSLENSTISGMKRIVQDHRQMIESFLLERKSDLDFIINDHSIVDLRNPLKLGEIFENLQKVSPAFIDLGIIDENGLQLAYHGPYELSGKIYDQAPWFRAVLENGFYISNVFLGYRQVPHFVIAMVKPEQNQKWILRATIDTRIFNQLVKTVQIGKTGEAYLLDSTGVFQTERRSSGQLLSTDPDRLKYGSPHDGIQTFIDTGSGGEPYLYATTWLKDGDWMLVVRQEKADAFRALRRASYLIVMTSILGGVLICAVAFYLTDRIIRRMQRMDQEKTQLSEQLIHAGRLAEIGEMAAGFAHEINNPLQIIKSEYTLAEMNLGDLKEKGELKSSDELNELEDSIRQIKHQVDRCAEVTQAILQFGRKEASQTITIDLHRFIPETSAMVSKKARIHGIVIEHDLGDQPLEVRGDPRHLQQVLINLLNNALDAVLARHGSSGGHIRIESGPMRNRHAEIKVRDNGSGISTENLDKIFTPFFTTKPVGKGTGLGLSVCFGIIDKMGGKITVDSQENVGTTFSIRLPSVN